MSVENKKTIWPRSSSNWNIFRIFPKIHKEILRMLVGVWKSSSFLSFEHSALIDLLGISNWFSWIFISEFFRMYETDREKFNQILLNSCFKIEDLNPKEVLRSYCKLIEILFYGDSLHAPLSIVCWSINGVIIIK